MPEFGNGECCCPCQSSTPVDPMCPALDQVLASSRDGIPTPIPMLVLPGSDVSVTIRVLHFLPGSIAVVPGYPPGLVTLSIIPDPAPGEPDAVIVQLDVMPNATPVELEVYLGEPSCGFSLPIAARLGPE